MTPAVFGLALDAQSRCAHWRGPLDIIAIRMRCCGRYYACRECHDEMVDHDAAVWPTGEWDQPAILCGACGDELTVRAYLACENHCPACGAGFNPGCKSHHHLYFEMM